MRYEDEFPGKRSPSDSPEPPAEKPLRSNRHFSSQFIIGAIIVVIGAALLLDNLGVIDNSREVLRFWPVILIVLGFRDLFVAKDGSRAMRGTLLVSFGTLFLLNSLNIINFNILGLWPLFLILFGVQMLIRSMSSAAVSDGEAAGSDESVFDDFALLGGVKRSISSAEFRGGSASALMGGVDIDLTKAKMHGDRAVVNVFALMGGVVLRIPEDWAVVSNVTALLGGVEDKTRGPAEAAKTLVLEGSAIMGGIEVKD